MSEEHEDLDLGATLRGFDAGQTVFGRYRLEKVLGRGGMGVVWLAYDGKLERNVALKFLPELLLNDRAGLEDLKRETRRSLELTHPNIVRIYDFVQDNRAAAISMEFVDGDSLRNLRLDQENQVYEAGQIGRLVLQLCQALEYAHTQAGIVHRDLKPANLMVNSKGQLKVADFGVARSINDSLSQISIKTTTSGTPVYMSPQQAMGMKASVSDDIYSIGATIYELLTGKPPFYSGNIYQQLEKAVPPSMTERRGDLNISGQEIPPQWETTVAACLAKDPGQRPQNAMEIAAMLGLVAAEPGSVPTTVTQPTTTPPEQPPAMRAAPEPRRSPTALIAAILAVLALAAGGAGYYFGIEVPREKALAAQAEQQRLQQEKQDQETAAAQAREEQARLDAEQKKAEDAARIKADEDKAAEAARLVALQANSGNPNILTVDMEKVFKAYSKTKDAETHLDADRAQAKKELDDRTVPYKQLMDEITKMNDTLANSALNKNERDETTQSRDAKLAEFKNLDRELTDFHAASESQLQQEAVQFRNGIVSDIDSKRDAFLAGLPGTLVLDKSGASLNGIPVVIYASNPMDFSDEVSASLNPDASGSAKLNQAPAKANDLKWAVVDMEKVFKAYYKTKDAEDHINEDRLSAKKDLDDRLATYKETMDAIKKLDSEIQNGGLSDAKKDDVTKTRDEKLSEFKNLDREMELFRVQKEKELQSEAIRMRNDIVADIMKPIMERISQYGYNIVLDPSGNGLKNCSAVFYSSNIDDMSDEIIAVLNKTNMPQTRFYSDKVRVATVNMERIYSTWAPAKEVEAEISQARKAAKLDTTDGSSKSRSRLNFDPNGNPDEFSATPDQTTSDPQTTQIDADAAKKRAALIDKIRSSTRDYLAAKGYNLVFDSSGQSLNGVGFVLDSNGVADVTDDILAVLNGTDGH